MYKVSKKLKSLKKNFRELNREHYSNISRRVAKCKEGIYQIQKFLSQNHTDEMARRKENELRVCAAK